MAKKNKEQKAISKESFDEILLEETSSEETLLEETSDSDVLLEEADEALLEESASSDALLEEVDEKERRIIEEAKHQEEESQIWTQRQAKVRKREEESSERRQVEEEHKRLEVERRRIEDEHRKAEAERKKLEAERMKLEAERKKLEAAADASSNSQVSYYEDERAEGNTSNRKYFVIAIVAAVLGLGGYLAWNSGMLSKSEQSESLNSAENSSNTQETKNLDPVIQQLIDNMVEVEGGTFTMGATYEQDISDNDEYPIHDVTLSSYKIGRYEVTQEEWEAVMGYDPASFVSPKRPVEFVSWDDCQDFIRKLNDITGMSFRMPTEAEWEFAARGGNSSNGYKYAGGDNVNKVGWNAVNSGGRTKEVGLKSPNELGLYDMTGNLWEWCSDWYGSYDGDEQTNPIGPGYGSSRVLRGGGWNGGDKNCRVSNRDGRKPDYSSDRLGLRLVL